MICSVIVDRFRPGIVLCSKATAFRPVPNSLTGDSPMIDSPTPSARRDAGGVVGTPANFLLHQLTSVFIIFCVRHCCRWFSVSSTGEIRPRLLSRGFPVVKARIVILIGTQPRSDDGELGVSRRRPSDRSGLHNGSCWGGDSMSSMLSTLLLAGSAMLLQKQRMDGG